MPGANSIQSAQQATACQTNLRQIHTALEAYRATNGTYPPAYSVDGNNRPMHSWRVLILPYLQLSPLEQMFVDQYDYTQPWDSSQNMRVSNRMPAVFQCPADTANVGSDTNYMAIVGPQSIFRAAKGVQMGQIVDDHSATLLIVETVGQMVPWTKPTDIAVATLAAGINSSSGQGISSSHPGGVHALMVDGTIRFLPQSTPASDIKGLSTIAGGELVPLSE